ncbi:hypothetical protein Btru_049865 [Bulinus truncatus]|nr:hypothetical protein Btru_049865 [Bulinus truncatus]
MRNVFKSWKAVSEIFKVERNADIEASIDHWITKRTLQAFFHWHEQLKLKRAEKMDNFRLCQKLFTLWLTTWKDNMAFRSHIDQIMLHKKLHMALLRWRQNVVILKRRQRNAVALIENCHMRKTFNSWRNWTAAKRTLRKKVTLHQKKSEDKTLQSCFVKWKESYLSRMEAETAKRIFAEACARRQYRISQTAKDIEHRLSQGLIRVILDDWRFFIVRKKNSEMLRERLIMKHIFYRWKNKATTLFTQRTTLQEELEANMELKKMMFNLWKENVLYQKLWMHKTMLHFIEKQNNSSLVRYFLLWRKLLHSSLISKAYHKTFNVRLLGTYFSAWQQLAGHSLTDAVFAFSERIGLVDNRDISSYKENSDTGDFNQEESNLLSWENTSTDTSESFIDCEIDRTKLLNVAIEAAKEDRQAKCLKLKETVTKAIIRIRHWPLCIAFEQWKEYSQRRVQLKTASAQLKSIHIKTTTLLAFHGWKMSYNQSITAHNFWAFLKWCKRLEQKRKTEQMYQEAWNRYLSLILHEWSWWANTNHRLRILRLGFEKEKSQKRLIAHFDIWKSVTVKVKSFRCNSKQKLLYRMFREWRLVVKDIQSKKHEVLQFQIHCYTLLVRRLFYRWRDTFQYRKKCSEERQLLIQHKALNFASVWRKKAQKTRGLSLKTLLEKRKLLRYFQHWASSLSHIQMLYVQLDKCLKHKHALLTRVSLRTWKIQLLAYQAKKMHMCRIMYTMLTEWKSWTRTSRERRIRGLALKKALQERNLHVYFQYWVAMTKVKLSVQQGLEIKLQIRVFRAWCAYTRQTNRLRELRAHMAHKVNMRIIQNTFMIMRWRAEYCTSLNEMADKVIHDREVATMRAVLVMWKDRLNSIEAVRCYQHILTVRVVKRWHKFVTNKYLEHQKEEDNWNKAVRFYNKFLCKSVLTSLKQEVTVHKLIERRRQRICENCAKMWKSRVDLTFTAIEMEREFYLRQFWSKWRTEYVKCSCTKNICNQYSRYSLKQIFKSWQKLCLKPSVVIPQNMPATTTVNLVEPRSSLLPIPVSQTKLTGGQKTPHKTVHNVS